MSVKSDPKALRPRERRAKKLRDIAEGKRCAVEEPKTKWKRGRPKRSKNTLSGKPNWRNGRKGNAVPPRLAWYLAIQMKKAFADQMVISKEEKSQVQQTIKQVPIIKIAEQYPNNIVNNTNLAFVKDITGLELKKRVLISLVKPYNIEYYENQSAKIYYTGKKFPTTVALNKLYYFMPYIKGRGVRDLYLIKIARVGTKQEVHSECEDNDFRLVFEIQYIMQLFDSYRPIHLNIWHTFTDTTMEALIKINEIDEE